MNRIVKALSELGPLTPKEIPYEPHFSQRQKYNIWKFDPDPSKQGSTGTQGLYYLRDEHEPKTVVHRWFDVNEELIETLSVDAIRKAVHGHGSEFGDVLSNSDLKGAKEN